MTPLLVLAGLGLLGGSGVPGLFLDRGDRLGDRVSNGLLWAGALLCAAAAVLVLTGGTVTLSIPASPLIGTLGLRLDAVGAMLLLQAAVIAAAGSTYGLAYWPAADHPDNARKLRLFYGLTAAGLGLVFVAADAITFLLGWETMALSAFFALTTDDRDPAVRAAGRLYLYCTRAGTLCLLAMFLTLRQESGTFALAPVTGAPTPVFVLGLLGFGLKAGVMPLHVWLPGAHASAPSHVSALMSGVLIKAGIYGLVRVLGLIPDAPAWWGAVIFTMGATSAVLGVAFAIGQHDLKRLLAWHSVENIGIILLGLGLAVVGRAEGAPALLALGLAGALLHTWNHGLFKSLLFLSAGAVIHGTGLRDIDRMGGLLRRMPGPGIAFLVGAVAICGLPPLNGFVSEFLIYSGLLGALVSEGRTMWLYGAMGTLALTLTGALALLCFAKVFGIAFLGEPRSAEARDAHASPLLMTGPMAALAALCVAIGLGPVLVAPVLDGAVAVWGGAVWGVAARGAAPSVAVAAPLGVLSGLAVGTLAALGLAFVLLRRRTADAPAARPPTWDCGYAAPSVRMQYTASSFAEQVIGLFAWALLPIRKGHVDATAALPVPVHLHSHVRDPVLDLVLTPSARGVAWLFSRLHRLQSGSLQSALLYLLIALVAAFTLA